jgi:hypothetical protein
MADRGLPLYDAATMDTADPADPDIRPKDGDV